MTREQKIDAFAMRIDGYSVQEIADKYEVSKQYISQEFSRIASENVSHRKRYIYPNIANWMIQNRINQTEMSGKIGINQATVSKYLTGKTHPSMKFIQSILEETGMPFEKAFYFEKEDLDE